MQIPIVLPDLGMASVRVSLWFVEPGDNVWEGERVVEILAGPATFDVSAPTSGRFAKRCALPEDRVFPGHILGYIDAEA